METPNRIHAAIAFLIFSAVLLSGDSLSYLPRCAFAQPRISKGNVVDHRTSHSTFHGIYHGTIPVRFVGGDTSTRIEISEIDSGDVLAVNCSPGVVARIDHYPEVIDSIAGTFVFPALRRDEHLMLQISNTESVGLGFKTKRWSDHPRSGTIEYWLATPGSAVLADTASLEERFKFFARQIGTRFWLIRRGDGSPPGAEGAVDFQTTLQLIKPNEFGQPAPSLVERQTGNSFLFSQILEFQSEPDAKQAYDQLVAIMQRAFTRPIWGDDRSDASDDLPYDSHIFTKKAKEMPTESIMVLLDHDARSITLSMK